MASFATTPSRRDRRQQAFARGLAVAVAALLTANGVVMAERLTGENISQVVGLNGDKAEEAAPEGSGMLERMLRAVEAGRNQSSTTGDTTVTTTGLVLGVDPGVSGPTSTSPGASESNSPDSPGRPPTTRGPRPVVVGGSSTTTGPAPTGGGSSSTNTSKPGASPTTTAPASKPNLTRLQQSVEEIGTYVQQARGLTFKRPVNVRVMSQGDFQSRVNRLRKLPSQDQIQTLSGILKALGVIADNVDLGAELNKLARQEVLAVYDPGADEVILPSEDPTPMLRTVLAGELTSALQHQWFNIVRPNLDSAEDESRDGFRALVAGSANTISDAYVKSLNQAEQAEVQRERQRLASQMPQDIPESVIAEFTFPYVAGPSVVGAIMTNGGSKRLDDAFSSPPTTSEQLFEPNRYLAREGAKAANYPAADGAVIRKGVLGQLNLLLMLHGVDNQTATQAASGWGGDRFVAWKDGARTCIRANIVMDSAEDSQQLGTALQKWVTTRPAAQVEGSGPFTITTCA